MSLFVVCAGQYYEQGWVSGVFSSLEKAVAYVERRIGKRKFIKSGPDEFCVAEWNSDDEMFYYEITQEELDKSE